ncbi:coiled-coil domain-containing protein 175 [Ciona intestinalis]
MEINELENEKEISEVSTSLLNVEATLQQLQDLALQTLDGGGEFGRAKLEEFQDLVRSIVDLEDERRRLHDILEVETICASKQRNALQVLPGRYKKEMEDMVLAARQANEKEMMSLHSGLSKSQTQSEEMLTKQAQLTAENAKLRPDCDVIRREHDEIIAQLNQRMSDKANKQIVLNESRDALRDTQLQTSDIDVGMANLEEDLRCEMVEADGVKQSLLLQVEDTSEGINRQKEKNLEEKKAIDKILDKILGMNTKLDEEQKVIRRLENSHGRLEIQAMQLQDKIERERKTNQEMANEREILQAAKDKQQIQYDEKVREMERKLKVVGDQLSEAEVEREKVLDVKDDVSNKKDYSIRMKSKFTSKVKEAALNVDRMKSDVNKLVEKSGEISRNNNTVREKLTLLDENHKATVDTYNTQIDEYKDNLNQERQERVKVQELRDESEKVLEGFRSEQLKFMNEMSKNIEEARQRHQELTDKSMHLNRETEKNLRNIQTLEVRLEVAEGGLRTMRSALSMEIERLSNSIEILGDDNERKVEYLNVKLPEIELMKQEVETRSREYSILKDEVVVVRNRERSVREQINRVNLQINKLVKPMDKLRGDLHTSRTRGMEQLEASATMRRKLEGEVYQTTIMLERVVNSNDGFSKANDDLQSEIDELKQDMTSHATHQRTLCNKLDQLQTKFGEAWEVCIGMEEASAVQDQEILEGISKVQKDTKERSETLNGISQHLKRELHTLTGFVENVADRRPKDTRQSKRRSLGGRRSTITTDHKRSPAIISKQRSFIRPVVTPVGTI